jgi:hypothetical protein
MTLYQFNMLDEMEQAEAKRSLLLFNLLNTFQVKNRFNSL